MSARESLFGEGPTACPFIALELDRDRRSDRPDYRHRCYAEPNPAPRTIAHQEAYCLSTNFPACPIFQDWAVRAAARPMPLPAGTESRRATSEDSPAAPLTAGAGAAAGAAGGSDSFAMSSASADLPSEPNAAPAEVASASSNEPDIDENPAWPDSMASSVSLVAATAPGAEAAVDQGGEQQLSAFDAAPSGASGTDAAGAAPGAPSPYARPASGGGTPAGDAIDEAGPYGSRPKQPVEGPRDDSPDGPGAAPVPAFLAGRSPRPRPSPGFDERVNRDDLVPSWEIDGRYGAHAGGPPKADSSAGRLFTIVAVIVILALGVLAVLILPGILAGSPTHTTRPSGSAIIASGSPLSSNVAVTPTPTSSAPTSPPPSIGPTIEPTPVASPVTYKIKAGDTLARVANRFHVTIEQILAANPQITNPDHIQVGQVINIPVAAATPAPS